MAREFAKKFYSSREWKMCRESYIKSVYGLCERCNGPGYIVHHKKHLHPGNINDTYQSTIYKWLSCEIRRIE